MSDTEILQLVAAKQIPAYKLETALGDHERGVKIRRKLVSKSLPSSDALYQLPYTNYDYTYVSIFEVKGSIGLDQKIVIWSVLYNIQNLLRLLLRRPMKKKQPTNNKAEIIVLKCC